MHHMHYPLRPDGCKGIREGGIQEGTGGYIEGLCRVGRGTKGLGRGTRMACIWRYLERVRREVCGPVIRMVT